MKMWIIFLIFLITKHKNGETQLISFNREGGWEKKSNVTCIYGKIR